MAKLIETLPPDSIFESEYILIQSQGMERMISQFMAIHFTTWCNYRFLLPVTFLQDIAGRLGLEITPDAYERSILCWRIENELRQLDTENSAPLRVYLQGEQAELKRFQLAGQLANIFDQYQLMRPDMLRAWQRGQTVTNNKSEMWQMQLWNRLTAAESAGRHRGELLQEVTVVLHEAAQKKTTAASLPKRISVFGIHILPPFFLDCLSGLAGHCDVHLFLLSPCRKYWGDMDRRHGLRALQQEETAHHPLLASLGKQGRDFQELLLDKMVTEKEFVSYENPMQNGHGTLLQQLQAGLLTGAIPEKGGNGTPTDAAETVSDDSLRFISCHSKKRELEVLRDHILQSLDCDDQLQLRDIVVMAPDIQQYAPYISAVFGDIQHSIADRSLSRRNSYMSVFIEFVDVFTGRFGWSELLDLLEKKEVSSQFDIFPFDFDRLRNWVVGSGIRWGLSHNSRTNEGLSFSGNSWQEGLERLLMGCAIDVEEEVAGVFPYRDIEGGEAKILGGLCAFIALLEEAQGSFKNGRRLDQWSLLLQDFAARLFGHREERELHELHEELRQLSKYAEFHDGDVSFEVIRQWLRNSSKESRSASGFLKGQLTFCSMLPMRSIPFKSVCLIGMNYGVFPANDPVTTFDLMRSKSLPGDRSLRADDRYQFLEVLLSARQSLYISYIGQSLQNNDALPPSVVVTELLEVLEKYDGDSARVENHPLHSFSSRYFNTHDGLFSYSEQDFLVAGRREEGRMEERQWWSGRLETVDCQSIDLADLFRFYRNPQLYFVQECLGVSLGAEREEPEESEIFQSSGLQQYVVNQLMLEEMITATEPIQLHRRLRCDGLWPLGVPGELFFAEKRKEMERFAALIEDEQMGKMLPDLVVDLRVGPYHLNGMLGKRYEGGFMSARYGDLRGKDLLKGWLCCLIGELYGISVSKIIMKDRRVVFRFEALQKPRLIELIEVYLRGRREPCKLLLEPAMVYCRQQRSGRARISPLDKAMAAYKTAMENGYEPAWSLLYGNSEIQTVLDQDFVALSEQLLCPLWSAMS